MFSLWYRGPRAYYYMECRNIERLVPGAAVKEGLDLAQGGICQSVFLWWGFWNVAIANEGKEHRMGGKIDIEEFKGAQGTAFLTLKPKAYYAQIVPQEEWLLDFSKVREICDQVPAIDFSEFAASSEGRKRNAAISFAVRSKAFEELLDKTLERFADEQPVVVHFGCGLSDRNERYKDRTDAGMPFYDVDFPDMIALRQNFYEETEHYKMLGADLSNYTWIEQIPEAHRSGRFIFVAEGVTPYLTEAQMKELFATLKEHFPGCIFILDTYTEVKLKEGKKEVAKYGATMHFINEDPAVMVGWGAEGEYRHLEEDNLMHRKDFLESKLLSGAYKHLVRFLARFFSWHKGIDRSTVVHVFQLGQRPSVG